MQAANKLFGGVKFSGITEILNGIAFRRAIWLFPIAFTLHVLEEVCCFSAWAQKYASPDFTFAGYLNLHLAGIAGAAASAFLLVRFSSKLLDFLLLSFVIIPAIFWNIVFHAGATIYFQEYSPGLISALAVYLPFSVFLFAMVIREKILGRGEFIAALFLAGVFHIAEVGHNVFKAW